MHNLKVFVKKQKYYKQKMISKSRGFKFRTGYAA